MDHPVDPKPVTPKEEPGAPAPASQPAHVEDAGSQALSEALRSSFVIVKIVMVLLVVVFLASGVFTVPSQERAVVLRFGRPVGVPGEQVLEPGLHWAFPYPIDEKVRLPVGQIQTVTSTAGWFAVTPEMERANEEPPAGPTLNPAVDGYAITADDNIIHARATLRYRISNPVDYALDFVSASNLLQHALDNALFYASAQFNVDQALRLERLKFQEVVLARVRQLIDQHKLGITIEQGAVETRPPRQVKQAFEDVTKAELDRQKAVNDAQGYANRILSTAQGEATTIVNQGAAEGNRLLQAVAADAKYFQDQLQYLRSNPELFMARLQAEAFSRVLTNVQDKIFFPAAHGGQPFELRLQLNREPQVPQTQPAK